MTWILFVFLVPVVVLILSVYKKQGSELNIWVPDWRSLSGTEPYMQSENEMLSSMRWCCGRVANANLSHFLYNQVGFPTSGNSQAQYFHWGDDKFPVLIEELNKAEKFIFMEYFIIGEGYVWDTGVKSSERGRGSALMAIFGIPQYQPFGRMSIRKYQGIWNPVQEFE